MSEGLDFGSLVTFAVHAIRVPSSLIGLLTTFRFPVVGNNLVFRRGLEGLEAEVVSAVVWTGAVLEGLVAGAVSALVWTGFSAGIGLLLLFEILCIVAGWSIDCNFLAAHSVWDLFRAKLWSISESS